MTNKDLFWIEANMNKFNGKHYTNTETKTHYMEYKGVVFEWNAEREIYEYSEYGVNE